MSQGYLSLCVVRIVIPRLVSSLVIHPSAPAKSTSRSAFTFTIPNHLEQISFHSFRDIRPRLSAVEIRPKSHTNRTHYAYVRDLTSHPRCWMPSLHHSGSE